MIESFSPNDMSQEDGKISLPAEHCQPRVPSYFWTQHTWLPSTDPEHILGMLSFTSSSSSEAEPHTTCLSQETLTADNKTAVLPLEPEGQFTFNGPADDSHNNVSAPIAAHNPTLHHRQAGKLTPASMTTKSGRTVYQPDASTISDVLYSYQAIGTWSHETGNTYIGCISQRAWSYSQ
jgi:hypothetical protein